MGDLRGTWRELVAPLADAGFRVAVLDLRGHGDADTTFTEHGDIATASRHRSRSSTSSAARRSCSATRWPGPPPSSPPPSDRMRWPASRSSVPFLRNGGGHGAQAALRILFRVLFARPWGAAMWAMYYRSTLSKGAHAPWLGEHVGCHPRLAARARAAALATAISRCRSTTTWSPRASPRCGRPRLILVGAGDPDYKDPAAELAWMGEQLGAETVLVPDAAHYAQHQRPDVVVPKVVAFASVCVPVPDGGRRVPRAGLSRDAVVDLAVDLVDAEGLGSLTLAAVAGRAGVAVPSLYKHVGSLAELRAAVALVAVRELTRLSAAATVGRSGDDALRALGHAIRGFAHQHPGLYAAGQIAPDPDADGGLELAQSAADAVALMGAVLRGLRAARRPDRRRGAHGPVGAARVRDARGERRVRDAGQRRPQLRGTARHGRRRDPRAGSRLNRCRACASLDIARQRGWRGVASEGMERSSTMSDKETATEQRWVAFGPAGAVGSIHRTDEGFAVRLMDAADYRGVYPTLDVAKSALHASMLPGSEWPEFREH